MSFDCLACGACCKVFAVVEVTKKDRIPLHLVMDTELAYKTMRVKRDSFECVCLGEGNICSIYENRPAVCRRFEVGSYLCRLARWKMGLGEFPNEGTAEEVSCCFRVK